MESTSNNNQNATPDKGQTLFSFKLPELIQELKEGESWDKSGRSAKTLYKTQGMRLVLNVMKAGTDIKPHHANGPISVHCLEGQLIFHTESDSLTLQKDEMLSLQEYERHSVEALEETSFLLTVAPLETQESQ